MDYHKLAADIITNVGGQENVNSVGHCMTRLRFILKDVKKTDKDAIQNLDGVVGVVYAGGQYQVILGQNLLPVYEAIMNDFDVKAGQVINENVDEPKKEPWSWKNAGSKIIGFVSGAVMPMVPGLVAGGMLKVALLLVVTFIDANFAKSSSYLLLSVIADSPFYFMPIFVAYGAATKLGATPIYSMVAAAALLHNNFYSLVTQLAAHPNSVSASLFGINVPILSYSTSLLPALLISLVAYYTEKFLNKIVPGIFKAIFVGMGTIFVAGSLGFVILGPLGNYLGQVIASMFMFLNSTIGPFAVGLLAAALPWMVMAGMHQAITPFMPQLLTNPGYDALLRPAFTAHNMAEGGANIGVALRTKNKKFRSECWSLAVGAIVAGVTEPSIYGVNLRLKKPMYGVMAGGFAGGIVAGLLGARAYIMGYSNLLALAIFEKTALAMFAGCVTSIVVAAIVTYIVGFEDVPSEQQVLENEPVQKEYPDDAIVAVASGELENVEQVNDEVFSTRMMGDGVAFKLSGDFICSPANGEIVSLFPTGHAFGIQMNDGTELLVHIGLDTVKLNGEGFDVLAKQGEIVRAGQPIVKVDRKQIEDAGYDLTTILVITDAKNNDIKLKDQGSINVGDRLN